MRNGVGSADAPGVLATDDFVDPAVGFECHCVLGVYPLVIVNCPGVDGCAKVEVLAPVVTRAPVPLPIMLVVVVAPTTVAAPGVVGVRLPLTPQGDDNPDSLGNAFKESIF